MNEALARLQATAKALGGELRFLSAAELDALPDEGMSRFPLDDHMVLDHKAKIAHVLEVADPGSVVHELGHLFATNTIPEDSDEWDFLGWEFALASELGIVPEWLAALQDYSIQPGDDFGALDADEQSELLEERYDFAVEKGLIVNLKPVSIRATP